MSGHFLAQFLLLFLSVYADFTDSKVHYITPSLDSPCPQNTPSCLTLSQFVANFSHNETDISLLFLPGNHTLDQELLLAHGRKFSISKYAKDNETIFIDCISQLGRFDIHNATSVSIKSLTFTGCGSNSVSQVKWLTIADSTFQGVENKSTVLTLSQVVAANVIRSQFFNNSVYYHDSRISQYNSHNQALDYIYHQRNSSSGVLYAAFSNVSIISSKFLHNRADIGGALVAHNSTLHIDGSAYMNNTATFGGAMVTSQSMIDIDNSSFTHNSAIISGGVMVTYNDMVIISRAAFTDNNCGNAAGVMMTFGDSAFIINKTNFTSNSATRGGVKYTYHSSSFTIRNSYFTFNSASWGGVVYTKDGKSSFTISSSHFISNSATRGGALYTNSGDSRFSINNTNFTSNSAAYGGAVYTYRCDSSITISNSNFTANSAIFKGGAIRAYYSYSSFAIDNNYFACNSATKGGVVYTSNHSSLTISHNCFTFNSAIEGGVIYTSGDSSFTISNINFTFNRAIVGGIVYTTGLSLFTISKSNFSFNNARYDGGVIYTTNNSSFTISNTNFTSNSAIRGGVLRAYYDNSSFTMNNSNFTSNVATEGGVVYTSGDSSFNITNNYFTLNSATASGGVMYTFGDSSFTMSDNNFTSNSATWGGVMDISGNSSFTIINSKFAVNRASKGGVMRIYYGNSSFTMSNNTFTSNIATQGGVMYTSADSNFNINKSIFTSNTATDGGVLYTSGDFSFTNSRSSNYFTSNSATYDGSVMYTFGDSSFKFSNSSFINNHATSFGGVIYCARGSLNIDNSNFNSNTINTVGGGLIYNRQCSTNVADSTFDCNIGSIHTLHSNLTFSGNSNLKNSRELLTLESESTSQEGGVITSFQSMVIFTEKSITYLLNNQARDGGAILAIESTIIMYGRIRIANNNMTTIANSSGGGISLKQSRLEIKGECNIVSNNAVRGGGIHATSSNISIYQPGILQLINNNAEFGGGMYLEVGSKQHVLKMTPTLESMYFLYFTGNNANYGGAVYVAGDTCSPDYECFIQTLAFYQSTHSRLNTVNILFSENTATKQGSNLFGGLLDRCIPSPYAEVYRKQRIHYSGVTYLQNISNTYIHSISSRPVRVCFCNSEHEPDCSYQLSTITVKKGETFNVPVVAVDQVNNTVNANIISSSDGGFGEGQQNQSVGRNCTDLTYNVFSPHDFVIINLFADGPCGNATLSTSHVTIQFTECICPVGFEPLYNSNSSIMCECVCDSKLSPYIIDCDYATSSVFRVRTDSWITYTNHTDPPGYIIHPNCLFDYCQPLSRNISINFNLLNGADKQCAYNHRGVLCGSCKENFSLSLASSHCLPCHSHWPAVFVVIILASILAGVLLVTALLALNMTVSIGLLSGFIFYANIVSAGKAVFFPSSEPSFPSVFIAWLNFDIGLDVCFIDGLDAYIKTWLQLAFPAFIISLVVLVIIVSEYSSKFARLIGRKDPISTLATLILLSYAKLLSVTITALSFAILDYPDGKQEIVWLPDGNVKYFAGKHIPLVLVALLIILIGLPYTILLFLWQWIVRAPSWKVFNWTRNTKLNAFVSTYHAPHNSKYRYWTGLLLLVRVVFYITASVTISTYPQTLLIISIVLTGGLIFNKTFSSRVYKSSFVDVVDTALNFNLLGLSVFSLYDFKLKPEKQVAVAYTSISITFILFLGSMFYHLVLLIKNKKPPQLLNEYLLAPVQPASAQITHSVIELPKRDQDPPSSDKNRDEPEISEHCRIVTPPY